ncbi:MAG: hypothetical protein Unbinned1520contig1002_28 [Prokaryotic dsDNA virus sp.]|nr:MAG: hypothetical protein Unbinned1520contig1002_28 [Prokaryotic dsDNA virus sp.]|tara:strand:+ start:5252 stop:5479 length:228 start_codon:yes stop_codon:yes gene_type:complete
MYNDNRMEIEKQFHKDMGFGIAVAEIKLREMRQKSNELFNLKCSLNGFCSQTNEKIRLSEDDVKIITERIVELES